MIYKNNYNKIQDHNQKQSSFTLAENAFMDLTLEEFHALYTGFTFLSGGNERRIIGHES